MRLINSTFAGVLGGVLGLLTSKLVHGNVVVYYALVVVFIGVFAGAVRLVERLRRAHATGQVAGHSEG